jgi:predicted N-acyltransferase
LIGKNSEEKHILSLLAEKIDAICKKERVLFSSFLFVSEFDRLLMDNLQNFSYLKSPGLTNFCLDVRWSSFKDYLESFNCKLRKNIRREIKKCAENGVTIEEPEFRDLPAYVSELTSNVTLKYNKNARVTSYSSFFSKLSEHAKDKTKVFTAKKNNEVVGFSLFLRQGDILDSCFTGFKYDVLSNTDFIYFNVCYYAPIRWAIKEGVRKIYYRGRGEKVKLHRGCEPEKTYSFVKCHDELLGPLINTTLRALLYSYLTQRFQATI